ncbi:MAG: hypothetical protein NTZ35_18090 [Ignavibacteriales bacterium]|nr:hypothetical protein [Ignavibacteriales bacterium]
MSNDLLRSTHNRHSHALSIFALAVVFSGALFAQDSTKANSSTEVSFSKDVAPVLDKFCTTCHSSEEDHPSELFMDSYELLMKGGKHGKAIVPGNSKESLFSQKMSDDPPFGKMMPPPRKPRPTPEQVALILAWIDQGAKKN